ncbi:hypothetical protein BC938DRAFT_481428, partial [Jimgerdemannia flammicorona]
MSVLKTNPKEAEKILTDFGVSKTDTSIARGSVLGSTLRYIAPERLLNPKKGFSHEVAVLSDIYSYAYIMWEVTTDGLLPYSDMEHDSSLIAAKINTGDQLEFVGHIPEETPQVFRDTVQQCLMFDPFLRPTLASVQDALDDYIVTAPAPKEIPFTVSHDTPRSLPPPTFNNSEIPDLRPDIGDDEVNALSELQKEFFEIAMYFYEDGKFTKAIERFQSSTLRDLALAQRMVAHCNKAIGEDPSEAFQAFKRVAERSDARGQFCLAWCYENRYGTRQNTTLAFWWYSRSVLAGNLEAAAVLRDIRWTENLYSVAVEWSANTSVFDFLRELFKSDASRTFAITISICAKEGDCRARYIYVIAYYSGSLLHHIDEHGWIYSELEDRYLISGGESFTIAIELSICGNELAQREIERRIDAAGSDSNDGINFSEGFRLLLEAAVKGSSVGSPFCQRQLASCYEHGVGVDKDVSESFAWNFAAANAGDVLAQCKLSRQYQFGEGTMANPELAFTWGLKAASSRCLDAYIRLGELYYDGIGTTKSHGTAINLFFEAVQAANANSKPEMSSSQRGSLAKAMYYLGLAHFYGKNATTNEQAAYHLFGKAADAGHRDAQWWAGLCRLYGHGTMADPKGAYALFLKAADEGHAWAMFFVGTEYIEGNYLRQDLIKAKEYLAKAADGGINGAKTALCMPYLAKPIAEEAFELGSNDSEQVRWKPDNPASPAKGMYDLGYAYFYGYGVQLDEQAAYNWFSKAADAGLADAQWWAGLCRLYGHGTTSDPKDAYALFLMAADGGHARAMFFVGTEYIEGNYLRRDLIKAKEYLAKAADGGINSAKKALCRAPLAKPTAEEAFELESNNSEQVRWKPDNPASLAKGMYDRGYAHFYGQGAPLNEQAAYNWISKAADAGLVDAQWWAGLCCLYGHGTMADPNAAYLFFQEAADGGHTQAMYLVGKEYIEGKHFRQDLIKAKKYMAKAADGGIKDARWALWRPPLADPASKLDLIDPGEVLWKPDESSADLATTAIDPGEV